MIALMILFKLLLLVASFAIMGRLLSLWVGPIQLFGVWVNWHIVLFAATLLLIMLEQSYLKIALNIRAQNDRVSHAAFIDTIEALNVEGYSFQQPYCEHIKLNFLYSYELCVRGSIFPIGNENQLQYSVYGIIPKGYLSLIPWGLFDRAIWDSFRVARLNENFEVVFERSYEREDDGGSGLPY